MAPLPSATLSAYLTLLLGSGVRAVRGPVDAGTREMHMLAQHGLCGFRSRAVESRNCPSQLGRNLTWPGHPMNHHFTRLPCFAGPCHGARQHGEPAHPVPEP